jgi:protease-4
VLAYPVWALRLAGWWLRELRRRLRKPPVRVSFMLEAPPPEPAAPPRPFWQRFLGPQPLTVHELARRLRQVTSEPRARGVLIQLRPLALSQAQVDALRDLIADVRAGGVRVTCWAPSYSAATYQVACAADEILLQAGGVVAPLGLARQYVFLAEALERVGLRADLLQVSPYKTAGDILTRRAFTPEAKEMAEWLADGLFAEQVAAVAAGRRLDESAARALVDASPFTDEQALAAGAVDALLTEEELPARLGGEVVDWASARRRLPTPRPARPGRVVALLRIEGMIVDGRSRRVPMRPPLAPPILFQDQCGDLTVIEQARAIAANPRVAAVAVWVDSGGGSATASEAIAGALSGLARRKPLVAAMGSAAGSGGYYVTTPAHRVFAHPGTVTGSVGVIAGKVVTRGVFDRLLVHRELVQRGAHSAMWHPDLPFTEAEQKKLGELVERSYELFLRRVAAARKRPVSEIEPVAGGRVWTGRQALGHGLVDELGGLERALAAARELGGLPAGAPVVEVRQGRRDLQPMPPSAPTTPAVLAHALETVAALQRAGAWCLCPLVSPDEG